MTTEEDFQNHLDIHPDDHDTRRIFGDWLEEHGDPRANGYRALGIQQRRPLSSITRLSHEWTTGTNGYSSLPLDWFGNINRLYPQNTPISSYGIIRHSTRRDAEDNAATSFNELPQERQHELLGLNTKHQMTRLTQRRKFYKRYANY